MTVLWKALKMVALTILVYAGFGLLVWLMLRSAWIVASLLTGVPL